MDARASDLGRTAVAAGNPEGAMAVPHAPRSASRLRRHVRSLRWPGSTGFGEALEAHRGPLFAYTSASIVGGLSMLA